MIMKENIIPRVIHEHKLPNIYEFQLSRSVHRTFRATARHISLHKIDIQLQLVDGAQLGALRFRGVSGHTLSEKNIRIRVDKRPKDKKRILNKEVPRSISHELHHAVRMKHLGHNRTLKEALVREGLATHFEQEVCGGKLSAWASALNDEQKSNLLKLAIEEIKRNDENYNHSRWFYGSADLPIWAGYTLGYYIVDGYLKLHPNESAGSLVATPADIIWGEVAERNYKEK